MAILQPQSGMSCVSESISFPDLPGAEIRSLTAQPVVKGWQYFAAGLYSNSGPVSAANSSFCNVTVTYTPIGTTRVTRVQIWLPGEEWNGRMQGVGGGGWTAGLNEPSFAGMGAAVIMGYAAIATDGGYTSPNPLDWAFSSPGKIDKKSFEHYATTSLNDLAIIGKSVVKSYYNKPPKYSYWNGCSQGGRQGFMLAQRYPKAFDGIAASAPIVNYAHLMVAGFWSQMTMNSMGIYPRSCEIAALTTAAVKACDPLDGVVDGLISDPDSCHFDPFTLVNTTISCGYGPSRKISEAAARVAKAGWTGLVKTSVHQYLWHITNNYEASIVTEGAVPFVSGLFQAMNVSLGLADVECRPDGTCVGKPYPTVAEWIKIFVQKDLQYDTSKIKVKEFDQIFGASVEEYAPIIGTDNPDLRAFRDAGGKIMSYHGLVGFPI
jgi:S-formylglutathione hydrolase FrmB